jgi:ankyrin repeat protein
MSVYNNGSLCCKILGHLSSGIKGTVTQERRPSIRQLVLRGNVEQLAKRLEKASSDEVNKADSKGQLPLHHAVETKQEKLVELLVSHNQTKGSTLDHRKRAAIHLAVRSKNLRIVDLVLRVTKDVDLLGANDRTPLHLAAVEGLPAIARLLLSRGANPLKRDRQQNTPIGIAAARGIMPMLVTIFQSSSLYDVGELMRSTSGFNASSLLHLAVESGSGEAVVYLLQLGIDKRINDRGGCTVLHSACRMGHLPLIRLLVHSDRWLLNTVSDTGVTPLHEAAKCDQVPAIDFLLNEGARISACTSTGAPPIFYAAGSGAFRNVEILLSRGADYLATDDNGANLLHCSVRHSKTLKATIEILKDRPDFKRVVSAPDNNGDTPLHYATKCGSPSYVTMLLECGADVHAVNRNGATPLHIASGRGHLAIATRISSFAPGLLHAVDGFGRTPLHIAGFYGHSRVLKAFMLNGAALTRDRDGRTPIHHAAWNGSKECLKALLPSLVFNQKDMNTDQNSLDTNQRELDIVDHEKATALHLAAARNHADAVTFLLDCKAKIADNNVGQNCLDIAIAKEFPECASAIVNNRRWKEAMKPLADNPAAISQMQLLVRKMPEQAVILMDNCIESSEKEEKRTYDFKYMLGLTEQESQIQHSAGQLFEAMLKLNRKGCFSHPLCVEFLNTIWYVISSMITAEVSLLLVLAGKSTWGQLLFLISVSTVCT